MRFFLIGIVLEVSMSRQRVSPDLEKCVISGAVALAILACAFPAWASLGGDTVSILADQAQMQGTRKATSTDLYTVHEIQADNGTVVREYQSQQGNVFAVSWHGAWMPNLQQVLGSSYDQYAQARQAQNVAHRRRGPISVDLPSLNVQIVGHPRWFAGRAYIPGKLPEGVRVEDIQ
jgi:hypothetical protein